ncbi:hypothetical protein ACFVY4_33685 [Streptomyces sp. NPDC058299]|uniref:hypothetical protein n=1 Tax=Streptomyces sp. NPDC058299 TaxID=3346435 RepID=UPI0036E241A5
MKAAEASRLWEEKVPEPVRAKAAKGARLARDNRTLVLAVAGAAAALWLTCRAGRDEPGGHRRAQPAGPALVAGRTGRFVGPA